MTEETQFVGPQTNEEAKRAIEAILLVATEPVAEAELALLLELSAEKIGELCHELAFNYLERGHGFQLVFVAGGWRYQTHSDLAPYVERFAVDGHTPKLSNAALETLSIVAYKQPISRGQISAIRGVNVDGVLRTLVQRGYVEEQGRDDGIGNATLFGTTNHFLERLGLRTLDDLPALGDFVPSAEVVEALEMTLRVDPEADNPAPTEEELDRQAVDQLLTGLAQNEGSDELSGDELSGEEPSDGVSGTADHSSDPASDGADD